MISALASVTRGSRPQHLLQHCVCDQRRLRSAGAFAQADQSLRCLPLDTWLYTEPPADPDQTARIVSEYLLGALGILCEILCPAQIMYILNCASSGYGVHVQMKQSC